jgi:two-component system nitrate/nitrite response regulator NarL
MLARAEMPVSSEYDDSAVFKEGQAPQANLIINIDTGVAEVDGDIIEAVRRQKSLSPQSRVVILSSRRDVPVIAAAFSTGADGYILTDISTDGLIGSLKLVMSGEKVFPTSILSTSGGQGAANNDSAPRRTPLSDREMGIVRHLAAGESNKAIAIALNIREATVKTHVKKILKKLGVANRTQAAVWAIANGFDKPLQ